MQAITRTRHSQIVGLGKDQNGVNGRGQTCLPEKMTEMPIISALSKNGFLKETKDTFNKKNYVQNTQVLHVPFL